MREHTEQGVLNSNDDGPLKLDQKNIASVTAIGEDLQQLLGKENSENPNQLTPNLINFFIQKDLLGQFTPDIRARLAKQIPNILLKIINLKAIINLDTNSYEKGKNYAATRISSAHGDLRMDIFAAFGSLQNKLQLLTSGDLYEEDFLNLCRSIGTAEALLEYIIVRIRDTVDNTTLNPIRN